MGRSQIWIVLLATAILALSLTSRVVADEGVASLSEETFEQEVGKDRGALVEFYAPW